MDVSPSSNHVLTIKGENAQLNYSLNDGSLVCCPAKENTDMMEIDNKEVIMKIIAAADDLLSAIQCMRTRGESQNANGLAMILEKKIYPALALYQVHPIKTEGEFFNPHFHNAVGHIEDFSRGKNLIFKEVRRGYTMNGKILRASDVIVIN